MRGAGPSRAGSPFPSQLPSASAVEEALTERLDEGVWRTRLPDGPVILSERMEGVRSAAVGIWFRQGSVHEGGGQRGISHLLEHMVFKGTARRSARELAMEIERVGGAMDAYTAHECTAYQARVPERHVGVALDVLADLAFHPVLRESDLELERRVVLDELAAIEDAPEELAFELHAAELYGEHPYGARVAGTVQTLEGLDGGALRRLHAEAYRGRNAIVAAAGRVDHRELVQLTGRLFPRGGGRERPAPVGPEGSPGHRRVERPGGRQAHLVAGALTVPHADPLRYAVVVVETALGGGMGSRLFQRVREERALAYTVYSFASFYAAAGHAGAYVCASPARAAEAREALLEELRRVAEEGLDEEELTATREQLKGQVLLSLESPTARMNRLAALAMYGEPYRTVEDIAARIDEVGPDQAREAAALLHPDRLTVVELVPA